MLILVDAPAQIRASFSFKAALLEGFAQELDDAMVDTGPIPEDQLDPRAAPSPIIYSAAPVLTGPGIDWPARDIDVNVNLECSVRTRGVEDKLERPIHTRSADTNATLERSTHSRNVDASVDLEHSLHVPHNADVDTDLECSTACDVDADAELERSIFGGDSPLSSPPPSRPSSPTKAKNSKQRRSKKRSRAKRAEQRREERAANPDARRTPKERIFAKHVAPAQEKVVQYSAEDIPCASTGYVATREKAGGVYGLESLLKMGFELVKWDGRSSKPVVDSNGLVVAVLVGQPDDPKWKNAHEEAFELLKKTAPLCNFTTKCIHHRRGHFAALNFGISFGGGPQAPGNLTHSEARTKALRRLVESTCFRKLAGFASSAFSTWMPKLHAHYKACLDALTNRHDHLVPNFDNSVWAAAAFNFPPQAVTARHRDAANIPFGICSVTALGKFDHEKGGHIVLWEFGLVVEFPAGSTILIPSAAVTHSNTPVQPHEARGSFTQYSAGGLFRWVDQGYQKSSKYLKSLSDEEAAKYHELNEARCALGMSLFSTLAEIHASGGTKSVVGGAEDGETPP